MALGKYYEDNLRIAEDRLHDRDENVVVVKPIRKSRQQRRKEKRANPFLPKKGVIDIKKNRHPIITMEFKQHLYEEWIAVLKENGWRWDGYHKCWYNQWSFENYNFASKFVHGVVQSQQNYYDPDDVYLDVYSNHGSRN